MKVTIISTPVHETLGITTIPASTEAEACRIASIDLTTFLTDTDMLSVALYGSHPSICAQYLSLPEGDYRKVAAEAANLLHQQPSKVSTLACNGFFNRQLLMLLDIGNQNSDMGAKIMPVFSYFLEHQDEHHLDTALVEDIQWFMTKRDFIDGYTLVAETEGTCFVMLSLWRRDVV